MGYGARGNKVCRIRSSASVSSSYVCVGRLLGGFRREGRLPHCADRMDGRQECPWQRANAATAELSTYVRYLVYLRSCVASTMGSWLPTRKSTPSWDGRWAGECWVWCSRGIEGPSAKASENSQWSIALDGSASVRGCGSYRKKRRAPHSTHRKYSLFCSHIPPVQRPCSINKHIFLAQPHQQPGDTFHS